MFTLKEIQAPGDPTIFDGAVKVYLKHEYPKRLANQMPNDPRSYQRLKVFRIDGVIDVSEWIELICLFYKLNEMVVEYLNPEYFAQVFAERIRRSNPRCHNRDRVDALQHLEGLQSSAG